MSKILRKIPYFYECGIFFYTEYLLHYVNALIWRKIVISGGLFAGFFLKRRFLQGKMLSLWAWFM